jgi:hypothetical protein
VREVLNDVITFFFALLLVLLFATYHPSYPGMSETAGWRGWYDQGKYLEQLVSILDGGLESVKGLYRYPPGLMLLSSWAYKLLHVVGFPVSTGYSLIFTNAALGAAAFVLLGKTLRRKVRYIFLLACAFIFIVIPDFRYSLVIPWSSSVTLVTLAYTLYFSKFIQQSREHTQLLLIFGLASAFSILFHTRPQDVVIVAVSFSVGYGVMMFQRGEMRILAFQIAIFFACLTALEFLWFFGAGWDLALGNIYTESQHAFFLDGALVKLFSTISGNDAYGAAGIAIIDRSPLLGVLCAFSFVTLMLLESLQLKIYGILWVLLYGSFSDFGPHNFMTYLLFHYFKPVFIVGLLCLADRYTFRVAILSLVFALLLSKVEVSLLYDELAETRVTSNEPAIVFDIDVLEIEPGDIFYLSATFQFRSEERPLFLYPPKMALNEKPLRPFKDYRYFPGSKGIYVHFLTTTIVWIVSGSTLADWTLPSRE